MKKIFVSSIRTNISLKPYLRHERSSLFCNTSARHERHECSTSTTRGKILILITARVKTYFRTPILAIRQMKNCRESRNFILRTTIYKCLVPTPKSFEKCTTKTELYNGESYIKKLYTRLQLQMPLHVPA